MSIESALHSTPLGGASQGALTLSQFANLISAQINAAPQLSGRWVVVEISRIGMGGPHCYCELIEKDASGATTVKMRGTIWANVWRQVSSKFYAATGKQIAAGMKVMFRMSASHSPAYGLSANINDVDPAYTLGDAERRRREILAMLDREGILERNKSINLPVCSQKIAVISSSTAAGYGDFMNQLQSSGFAFYTLLYPAALQGAKTAESVMAALDRIEMAVDFWDAVVIIRGGGATDDLNSFDDPELARRVATYPLPVIVGIGHERDRTVLDEIAHTRCKTPTAVAAFLIDSLQECETRAIELTRSIIDYTRQAFLGERRRLERFSSVLPLLAPGRIESEYRRLDNCRSALVHLTSEAAHRASELLMRIGARLETATSAAISRPKERLKLIPELLRRAVEVRIDQEERRLRARKELIDVLGPEATLKRGYSITRVKGKAIRNASAISPGDRIVTSFAEGEVESEAIG